jgi:hypothetical protein
MNADIEGSESTITYAASFFAKAEKLHMLQNIASSTSVYRVVVTLLAEDTFHSFEDADIHIIFRKHNRRNISLAVLRDINNSIQLHSEGKWRSCPFPHDPIKDIEEVLAILM